MHVALDLCLAVVERVPYRCTCLTLAEPSLTIGCTDYSSQIHGKNSIQFILMNQFFDWIKRFHTRSSAIADKPRDAGL